MPGQEWPSMCVCMYNVCVCAFLNISCFTICTSLCCVLSHSVVSNFATPWSVAHQAPLSMGILQQEYGVGYQVEWVIKISRRSSHPRGWTQVSRLVGGFFYCRSLHGSPSLSILRNGAETHPAIFYYRIAKV